MRLLLALTALLGAAAPPRANFVLITVKSPPGVAVRAIWRPHVGAVGGPGAQQASVRTMFGVPNAADSAKRWRDPAARDTFAVRTPVQLDVDMNGGPIWIEVDGSDSVFVEASLFPLGSSIASGWGRSFSVSADGNTVTLERHSGNPIITGWYADPEAHVFDGQYWIFPTYSAPYGQQTFLDAFSSRDLVTWTRHPHVLDTANVSWAHRAVWAPSIVEKDGWYYLFFGANDIQNDQEKGGIGVARSRSPAGPFKDYLGKPLIDAFHNGAQPIDQMVFQDVDGAWYIVYGGWRHCNIAKLNADFTALVPFPDGSTFKEITPAGYVEGAFMLVKDGKYYFMWSEGGWTGPNYAVAYAVGTSPFGPFERVGKILQQDQSVATGAGHHSVLHQPGSPNWYIVYHRRPLGETDANHRVVSIDALRFDPQGGILPVAITRGGVAPEPIRSRPPSSPGN